LFRANIEVLEYYKATVGESHLFVDDLSGTRREFERKKIARNCTIAIDFLKGADSRRYSTLWSDLANQKTRGNDQYPGDSTAANSMLVNYFAPHNNRSNQSNVMTEGSMPTATVTVTPGDIGAHTFTQTGADRFSFTTTVSENKKRFVT
jgi:hypothetical protein